MNADLIQNYVVATVKNWNIDAFQHFTSELPGTWHLITSKDELSIESLKVISPKYIFFPHWSWIVPQEILREFECVCFHMTDVPYGRGGSPLQNLIVRGHTQTKLTALRMASKLDAGPVYGKLPMELQGRAEDIYKQVADLCYDHIKNIVHNEPKSEPQCGDEVYFPRRTPEQSELPVYGEEDEVYDHIRMLDAPSYPRAFVELGNYRLEFSHAEIVDGQVEAKVTMIKKTE
jgi:methionyl-tRNA formyltransferase